MTYSNKSRPPRSRCGGTFSLDLSSLILGTAPSSSCTALPMKPGPTVKAMSKRVVYTWQDSWLRKEWHRAVTCLYEEGSSPLRLRRGDVIVTIEVNRKSGKSFAQWINRKLEHSEGRSEGLRPPVESGKERYESFDYCQNSGHE